MTSIASMTLGDELERIAEHNQRMYCITLGGDPRLITPELVTWAKSRGAELHEFQACHPAVERIAIGTWGMVPECAAEFERVRTEGLALFPPPLHPWVGMLLGAVMDGCNIDFWLTPSQDLIDYALSHQPTK